nr:2'-5' RNA ligase family protein [Algoriphagus locisalis]
MQKYFLAIVPEGKFQEQVTQLKWDIREKFQSKYALKSPAHITVKMPFSYNEAKEEKLFEKLQGFIAGHRPMTMNIAGVKTFGSRVIYLGVEAGQDLFDFQSDLKTFCKRELNLVDELSDRNFHPHMTIAFKDIKKTQFQNILEFATEARLTKDMSVNEIVLLKKVAASWVSHKKLSLKDV